MDTETVKGSQFSGQTDQDESSGFNKYSTLDGHVKKYMQHVKHNTDFECIHLRSLVLEFLTHVEKEIKSVHPYCWMLREYLMKFPLKPGDGNSTQTDPDYDDFSSDSILPDSKSNRPLYETSGSELYSKKFTSKKPRGNEREVSSSDEETESLPRIGNTGPSYAFRKKQGPYGNWRTTVRS